MKKYSWLMVGLIVICMAFIYGCGSNATSGGGSSGGGGGDSFTASMYVSTSGDDTTGEGTLSKPYRTIQKAMLMAGTHEVIGVLAGVYTGEVTWTSTTDVTLRGINKDTVTLEVQANNRGISLEYTLPGNQIITIEGMTIKGANYTGNGAALNVLPDNITLHLKNLIFDSNNALGSGARGGAVYFESILSTLVVDSCTILNNTATLDGSAIYTCGRLLMSNSLIKNNVNTAGSSSVYLSTNGALSYIYGSTFEGNSSFYYAAGLYNNVVDLTVEASTFKLNKSDMAGAIWVANNTAKKVVFKNCLFEYNRATNGAGAMIISNPIKIERCTFTSNTTEVGSSGGAIYFENTSTIATIENTVFYRNKSGSSGGAIYYTGAASGVEMHVVNCDFVSNEAANLTWGSAIHIANNGANIMNSIFYNNKANPAAINNAAYNLCYSDYDFDPLGAIQSSCTNDAVAFSSYPTDLSLSSSCPITITEGATFEYLGISAPTVDRNGNTRTIPYSMGAYEKD